MRSAKIIIFILEMKKKKKKNQNVSLKCVAAASGLFFRMMIGKKGWSEARCQRYLITVKLFSPF